MGRFLNGLLFGLLMGSWMVASAADEVPAQGLTREQIQQLDTQIQDVKSDVLDISKQLTQLEDKLAYPPNTRILIFLAVAQGGKFQFDSVKIRVDGKDIASHLYTPQESDAIQNGGIQPLYTGNIRTGEHMLEMVLIGKSTNNSAYQQSASYKFTKDPGTKLIEITVSGQGSGNQGISFKD